MQPFKHQRSLDWVVELPFSMDIVCEKRDKMTCGKFLASLTTGKRENDRKKTPFLSRNIQLLARIGLFSTDLVKMFAENGNTVDLQKYTIELPGSGLSPSRAATMDNDQKLNV